MVIDREAAGRYVLSRRTAEGGYCFYRTPQWGVEEPNAPDTLAALGSLRLLGIAAPAPQATGRWVRALQSRNGSYSTLTIGWAAVRALDLLGLEPDHSPLGWLSSWVPVVLRSHGRREWRGALLDALRLLELSRLLGVVLDGNQRRALTRLLAAAADGEVGRWARPGADLETTAVAVRVIELGDVASAGAAATEELLRSCEDPVLGLRLAPDAAATSVGALWGGLAIARARELRLRYPQAIGHSIGLLQRPNGGLGARDRAIPTLRDTWLGLRAARLLDPRQEKP